MSDRPCQAEGTGASPPAQRPGQRQWRSPPGQRPTDRCGSATLVATPPPKAIQVVTEADRAAWRKATRFALMWQEAIIRSGTLASSAFTLADKQAAYRYFRDHPAVTGDFPLAVAIHAWQLARQDAQPSNKRRQLYHIPHSLDPRQFLASMSTGKIEAEVGLFDDVNAWETHRWWFTESELVYWGWNKAKLPILPLDPDQLWEYDPATPRYYRDRHRDLPPEVAAVVHQAAAATAAKGAASSPAR